MLVLSLPIYTVHALKLHTIFKVIKDFKKGYRARVNVIKSENQELLADSNSILNRWKDYLSQLLNVHKDNDVGVIEIQTVEPLIPDPTHSEVEIVMEQLKKSTSLQVSTKFRQN